MKAYTGRTVKLRGVEMEEAMGLQAMFLATMAGAAIVLLGACYALFFALGRLHTSIHFAAAALTSYALLAGAVYVMVRSLQLDGVWIAVVVVMLAGYFLLPRAIWRLCVGTHGDPQTEVNNGASR